MTKLKMHTPDLVAANVEKIAELFPGCVTEARDEKTGELTRKIDFDQLRQELSDHVVDGPRERYHLDWPGKREALLAANAPIAKTLRPCREESADFDTTKNLFIEGDNLDALKLLQETYLGKVKLIYIDPPYNTGNQFIFNDNFFESSEQYLHRSNQVDPDKNRLVSNSEATGRRHSNWLSLIYSRLRLVKNLMSSDGVTFISIDDSEVSNLRRICDEVFGEENFVGTVIWKNVTDNNPTNIATEHEYVHVYARSKTDLERTWKSSLSEIKDVLVQVGHDLKRDYKTLQELQAAYSNWFRENKTSLGPLDRYKYIDFGGVYTGSQSVHNPGKEGYRYDVMHPVTKKPCKAPLMGYRFPKSTMDDLLEKQEILFGEDESKIIELKVYAKDFEDKLSSVLEIDGRLGAYDLRALFPEVKRLFTNPKPVALIERFASFGMGKSDIALDIFGGSGTTAHAIMKLNAKDGGQRRFVIVQMEEATDPKSEAAKAGYFSVSKICKERILRAAKLFSNESHAVDRGFRVLKVDTSNLEDVYYSPVEVRQHEIVAQVDNVKKERSSEDLLFHLLVDWGIDLSFQIERQNIAGSEVFFVDGNALAACFDQNISEDLVKELAKRKPLRAVFRDSSYDSDSTKVNVEQIFKLLSPETEVRTL